MTTTVWKRGKEEKAGSGNRNTRRPTVPSAMPGSAGKITKTKKIKNKNNNNNKKKHFVQEEEEEILQIHMMNSLNCCTSWF